MSKRNIKATFTDNSTGLVCWKDIKVGDKFKFIYADCDDQFIRDEVVVVESIVDKRVMFLHSQLTSSTVEFWGLPTSHWGRILDDLSV